MMTKNSLLNVRLNKKPPQGRYPSGGSISESFEIPTSFPSPLTVEEVGKFLKYIYM
jgi:hypothetical protein